MKITLELKDSDLTAYIEKRRQFTEIMNEVEQAKAVAARFFNAEALEYSPECAQKISQAADEVNHCVDAFKETFWQLALERIEKKYPIEQGEQTAAPEAEETAAETVQTSESESSESTEAREDTAQVPELTVTHDEQAVPEPAPQSSEPAPYKENFGSEFALQSEPQEDFIEPRAPDVPF